MCELFIHDSDRVKKMMKNDQNHRRQTASRNQTWPHVVFKDASTLAWSHFLWTNWDTVSILLLVISTNGLVSVKETFCVTCVSVMEHLWHQICECLKRADSAISVVERIVCAVWWKYTYQLRKMPFCWTLGKLTCDCSGWTEAVNYLYFFFF